MIEEQWRTANMPKDENLAIWVGKGPRVLQYREVPGPILSMGAKMFLEPKEAEWIDVPIGE